MNMHLLTRKPAILILYFLPIVCYGQAYKVDESNSPQDWANTFNSIIHVEESEKVILYYFESCKSEASIQEKVKAGKETWYKNNGQFLNASKWAVDYYGFTIEKKSGISEAEKFKNSIDINSDKQSSELIKKINDASKSLTKPELCLMVLGPNSEFVGDLSIHKVFNKYIIKIREMHKEYLQSVPKK